MGYKNTKSNNFVNIIRIKNKMNVRHLHVLIDVIPKKVKVLLSKLEK